MSSPESARGRSLRLSYALLLLGSAAPAALFAAFSRIWQFVDSPARIVLFILWMMAPGALLAFNTFIVSRYLHPGQNGGMFLRGTLTFLGSGLLIYGRAAFLSGGGAMETSLSFLFGPFLHFAVTAVVTVAYLARSVRLILARRAGR